MDNRGGEPPSAAKWHSASKDDQSKATSALGNNILQIIHERTQKSHTSMSNGPSRTNDDFDPVKPNSSLSVGAHKTLCSNISVSSTQTAGNYDILNDLGEGTFGSVKLGKHS